MMSNQPLLFRADASEQVGTGHVMRCLALAQAWRDAGGSATLLTTELPSALADRWRQENIHVVRHAHAIGSEQDARQTAALAQEISAGWIVADGYDFAPSWQRLVKESAARLLLCDDGNRTRSQHADVILDASPLARPEQYARSPARLLLGPRYVLLRREFYTWREWQRDTSQAHRILVTLGGADADNFTLNVLRAVERLPDAPLEVTALIGSANPHAQQLQTFAATMRHGIMLRTDALDVAAWMAWADVAIAAGGTTTWERAFMRLPSLTLVVAENQRDVARAAEDAGVTRNLGPANALDDRALSSAMQTILEDATGRERMAKRGRELVDGEGVERVLIHLTDSDMRLRRVRNEDAELLWRWANDPAVRRASFTDWSISWEEHREWFARKHQEPGCLMLLGVDADDVPIGQVRIDGCRDGEAEIHVSIAGERRGQGWGGRLIGAAIARAERELRVSRIHAYIKLENTGSLRAFEKAGFQDMGFVTRAGNRVRHEIFVRESASCPSESPSAIG